MNPQDPHTLTPDEPAAPTEAQEADDAVAGEIASGAGSDVQGSTDPLGSVIVTGSQSQGGSSGEDDDEETHWVSVELVYDDGTPVKDEPVEIKLPKGQKRSDKTDENGKFKVEKFKDSGTCEVNFTKICKKEWKQA